MTRGRLFFAAVLASSALLLLLAGCKRLPTGSGTGVAPLPSGALPVAARFGVSRRPARAWLLMPPAKSTPSSRAVIVKLPVTLAYT